MSDPYAKLRAIVAEKVEDHLADLMDETDYPFASPIERLFFVALVFACRYGQTEIDEVFTIQDHGQLKRLKESGWTKTGLLVEFQPQLEGWKPDFLIHYYDHGYPNREPCWRSLIIECDGHDFHERTKKQAARDRKRDRTAQHHGIPVLRFTGSELWADAWGCAIEVIAWAQKGF